LQGQLESTWRTKETIIRKKYDEGIDESLEAIDRVVVGGVDKEVGSLTRAVSRAGHPVADRYLVGPDVYLQPGGAVLSWIGRKQQQIRDAGGLLADELEVITKQHLCSASHAADNAFALGHSQIEEISMEIDKTADSVKGSITSSARNLCNSITTTVTDACDTLQLRDDLAYDHFRSLLDTYPDQVFEGREQLRESIREVRKGLRGARKSLDDAKFIL